MHKVLDPDANLKPSDVKRDVKRFDRPSLKVNIAAIHRENIAANLKMFPPLKIHKDSVTPPNTPKTPRNG